MVTVIKIDTIPAAKVAMVFLKVLNHSTKCDENNIRGMAMGTVKFIIHSCRVDKAAVCSWGIFMSPDNAMTIPTAYASNTVPIFEKKRKR
jgi:hypothetical protein